MDDDFSLFYSILLEYFYGKGGPNAFSISDELIHYSSNVLFN